VATPAHRLLVDVAVGLEGFAGIPQEARLLLQSFWQTPGLAPTALLYDDGLAVACHRFHQTAAQARQLENHAVYLFNLAERQAPISPHRWLNLLDRGRKLLRQHLGLFAQMQRLDNTAHGETAWRLFLSQTLGPAGLTLANQCPLMIANLSRKLLKYRACVGLPTLRFDTRDFDFLLMHEALPLRIRSETCKLVRYHDMIPGLRPEFVGSRWQIRAHFRGLRRCLSDAVFVCNSEPTRDDLIRAFPELYERAVIIPDLLGDGLFPEPMPRMLPWICQSRQVLGGKRVDRARRFPPYLLSVSTIEPRKNHLTLIRAFERLAAERASDLILMLVGARGWRNKEIVRAMKPLVDRDRLVYLSDVPPHEMRVLYTHAEAVAFPSFYEGFGYSPLEAMQCGVPALVSDIAAHRWVYGDAVLYFDPFDADDLRRSIERLVFTERATLRPQLVERGRDRIQRYSSAVIGQQWLALCDAIRAQGGARKMAGLKLADVVLARPNSRPTLQLHAA
jgi:glycosyltransferase involved in cell wall biosynthesis